MQGALYKLADQNEKENSVARTRADGESLLARELETSTDGAFGYKKFIKASSSGCTNARSKNPVLSLVQPDVGSPDCFFVFGWI